MSAALLALAGFAALAGCVLLRRQRRPWTGTGAPRRAGPGSRTSRPPRTPHPTRPEGKSMGQHRTAPGTQVATWVDVREQRPRRGLLGWRVLLRALAARDPELQALDEAAAARWHERLDAEAAHTALWHDRAIYARDAAAAEHSLAMMQMLAAATNAGQRDTYAGALVLACAFIAAHGLALDPAALDELEAAERPALTAVVG